MPSISGHERLGSARARSSERSHGREKCGVEASRKTWSGTWSELCCQRVGLEHIAPHDLRRTCAKLCHDRGGELEQIQFLLGHASVQTTEHYLGCKQNLGHPVNDLFDLRTNSQQQTKAEERVPANGARGGVEKAHETGIECRDGGSEHEQPIREPRQVSLPERTDVVENGKGCRPQSFRRCFGSGAARSDSENKANGERHPAVIGSVGFGKVPDPTP